MIDILKKIVEESSDLVCTLDSKGEILWINKTSKIILGLTPAKLKGRLYIDFVHENDLDKWEKALSKQKSVENQTINEIRHIRSDGDEVLLLCSVIWNSSEKQYSCIGKTISNSKEVSEALKKTEEKYQILFDLSPIPKHVYDLKTLEILDVNQAAIGVVKNITDQNEL